MYLTNLCSMKSEQYEKWLQSNFLCMKKPCTVKISQLHFQKLVYIRQLAEKLHNNVCATENWEADG